MRQGINPHSIEEDMTMWDYQQFITGLLDRLEADNKKLNEGGKNNLMEHLVYIRDILNHMKLPGHKNAVSG